MFLPVINMLMYLGWRIRNEQNQEKDPQLGRKFVLHFFLNIAILIFLVGMTISSIDINNRMSSDERSIKTDFFSTDEDALSSGRYYSRFDEDPFRDDRFGGMPGSTTPAKKTRTSVILNQAQRTAMALMLTGLVYGLIVLTILVFGTNYRKFNMSGQSFWLFRLVISGMITILISAIFLGNVIQKKPEYSTLIFCMGIGIVWGPVAFLHMIVVLVSIFSAYNTKKYTPSKKSKKEPEPEIEIESEVERNAFEILNDSSSGNAPQSDTTPAKKPRSEPKS